MCGTDGFFFAKLAYPAELSLALTTVRNTLGVACLEKVCGCDSFFLKLGAPRSKVCNLDATNALAVALLSVRANHHDDDVFVAQLNIHFFAHIFDKSS